MNEKELTPLEALEEAKNRKGLPLNENFAPVTEGEIEIIEKALKEYQEIKIELKQVMNDYQDLGNSCYKKLKALEIIKLFIESLGLKFIFLDDDRTIFTVDDSEFECWHKCKTQKEYDLLKEALL